MSLCLYRTPQYKYVEGEHDTPMLESCLTFLATLVNVRTNLGKSLYYRLAVKIMWKA